MQSLQKFTTLLKDLDYADDITLLCSKHQHMQEKTEKLCKNAESPIEIRGRCVEDVDTLTYLGAIVNKTGQATEDIKHRLQPWPPLL